MPSRKCGSKFTCCTAVGPCWASAENLMKLKDCLSVHLLRSSLCSGQMFLNRHGPTALDSWNPCNSEEAFLLLRVNFFSWSGCSTTAASLTRRSRWHIFAPNYERFAATQACFLRMHELFRPFS